MRKKISYKLFYVLLSISVMTAKAQLSGSYFVPGTYTSVAAVINDLNTLGISGPVTINISSGYTETAPLGGYTLTATGTLTNPIIFQKNGIGSNPLIYAPVGTFSVLTSPLSNADGIFVIGGSDFITFDGIDLLDTNPTGIASMEYGYGFYNLSSTDGAQNNTVKNCTITLNRNEHWSKGIDMLNVSISNYTTYINPASPSGSNSFNKFYNNTIQNCNRGISIQGKQNPATGNEDRNNDVGGSSVSTGNTIINYGGSISSMYTIPAIAILAHYQKGLNVAYNLINNNNGSGAYHYAPIYGISVAQTTLGLTSVLNNTITIKSFTSSYVSPIIISAGSVSGIGTADTTIVDNNLITACTNSCSSGGLGGIGIGSINSGFVFVRNNRFINNSSYSSSGAIGCVSISNVNKYLELSNNYIDGISSSVSNSSVNIYAIDGGVNSTGTVSVNSNTLLNVSFGPNPTGSFSFIGAGGGASSEVKNNIFTNNIFNTTGNVSLLGGSSDNLSIKNNTLTNLTSNNCTQAKGISVASNSKGTVNDNLLSNLSFSNATFIGIDYGGLNSKSVTNNTVSNVSTYSGGSMVGLNMYSSFTNDTIFINNNIFSNFISGGAIIGIYTGGTTTFLNSNTINSFTTGGDGTGIYVYGVKETQIHHNKVADIESVGSGTVIGIEIDTYDPVQIYNNLIGDLRSPFCQGDNSLRGVSLSTLGSNSAFNVFYNSIYLNAMSPGTNFGSSGIYHQIAAVGEGILKLRNNIIVNTSAKNGFGKTVAFRRSLSSFTIYNNYDPSCSNNLFYAGTPGNFNLLYSDYSNEFQTILAYKTAVYPREISSVSENPPFLSVSGGNNNFLGISTSIPTQVQNGATPLVGITDDYLFASRNVLTPDIGAREGNYTLLDLSEPIITNLGYSGAGCSLTSRTFTVKITDVSGVATGTLSPLCYYKVNSGPFSTSSGTLTSGTINNGVWTFNLNYAAVFGDVISHFITAQDIVSSPNVGSSPWPGFSATSVTNIITNPTTIYSYTATGTLNGTYTVGAAGTFTTLSSAAYAYNNSCITGPVTFVLTNATYSSTTGETFPITFQNTVFASNTNSLLITSGSGVNATISGTSGSSAIIKFLDAKYITINGTALGGTLNINTINSSAGAVVWIASTSTLTTPGCKKITLSNINIKGGSNTFSNNYGIFAGNNTVLGSGGIDNDSIAIKGVNILRSYFPIFSIGTNTVSSGGFDSWDISNNIIGPASTGTDNIGGSGIYLKNILGSSVYKNLIRNISANTSNNICGIDLSGAINIAVDQNTLTTLSNSNTAAGANIFGINLYGQASNISITKNIVSTVFNSHTTGYGARGINVNASVSNINSRIENNMVSDIFSYSRATSIYWPMGICIEGSSGGINIDNNTVNLEGLKSGSSGITGSAAFYISSTGNNVKLRNNILSNTYNNNGSITDVCYSIYSTVPATIFTNIDNNDYFAQSSASSTGILGYVNSLNQNSLFAIQSSFSGNLNSVNSGPSFSSPTDLHLISWNNCTIDNLGAPLAGITDDIDNQIRGLLTPDIGADEFTCSVNVTENSSLVNSTNVYPNPSNGIVYIKSNLSNVSFVLYDCFGRAVKEQELINGTNIIHLEDLSKGLYLIIFNNNQEIWSSNLILE